MSNTKHTPDEIRDLPTLSVGQCCSLKVDTGEIRVWLCRVAGGVTIERCRDGRWSTVEGSCVEGSCDDSN